MRATRGLRYWVARLIVLPLPAASRPSNTTTSRRFSVRTHSWTLTISAWRRNSSRSYTFFGRRSVVVDLDDFVRPAMSVSVGRPGRLGRWK